jgi:Spy/CpxP family protein refolding chaperone
MAQPPQPTGDQPQPPQAPGMRRMGMQPRGPRQGQMGGGMMQPGPGRGGMQPGVRGFENRLLPGPHGKWWDNPQMAGQLGLTADQKKKMDEIFQQNRLKLVDLNAAVQKAELTMEPLVAADQPDETRIVAQIDKVAQARAELEKANARMLLGIRGVLTPEQFQKLQLQARTGGRGPMGGGMQPRRGPAAPQPPSPPVKK